MPPSSHSSHSSYRPSSYSSSSSSRRPPYTGSSYVPGYANSSQSQSYGAPPPPPHNPPQQLQTQQIYIPNDLVGCIIGKGGSKINEIRHMSASQIKIMEPGSGLNGAPAPAGNENERLVVITGQPANIQMAVQLLYHVCCSRLNNVVNLLTREFASAVGTREAKAVTSVHFIFLIAHCRPSARTSVFYFHL
jgi:heterogeneous nuclear rnp K-like protein 2